MRPLFHVYTNERIIKEKLSKQPTMLVDSMYNGIIAFMYFIDALKDTANEEINPSVRSSYKKK